MNGKLCIVYGTRPEIIKLSPVIKFCRRKNIPFFCVHTGQHYSYKMDKIFLKELNLPAPEYSLKIKSKAPYMQGEHTGRMLIKLEKILLKELPYCIIVQGDTNSGFAGALTAEKISTTESYTGYHVKVAHLEAGLRSFDRSMPEETNRFITDHLSDFLFAPTEEEKTMLLREGVDRSKIFVVGNTIVDAVKESVKESKKKSRILKDLGLKNRGYIMLTLHRQENVDSKKVLADIMKGLELIHKRFHKTIIFPIHPRTTKMMNKFRVNMPDGIRVIKPLGFLDFLWLEANAFLILTDSGGVQEEACILRVPCVTIRNNTERPETVSVGSNIIAGTMPETILKSAVTIAKAKRNWENPFGDGRTSEKMFGILLKELMRA